MSYVCNNLQCSAPENKMGKVYPSAMECPFCDEPLESNVVYSELEVEILSQYPYVIAYPFERMLMEEDGRNKLELLAYTFLNGMKLLGLVVASEYFQSPLKSAKINELFRNNLYHPSFGNWNNFLRDSVSIIDREQIQLVYPEFVQAYKAIERDKNAPL